MNVVFQGVEGAYSYAAQRAYFSDAVNSYHVKTFRDAMEEVASGKADYAVLPIENSTEGIVTDIYDLLTEYQLYIRRGTGRESGACSAWNSGDFSG